MEHLNGAGCIVFVLFSAAFCQFRLKIKKICQFRIEENIFIELKFNRQIAIKNGV